MKEYGALRRTVYAARYLADETYRRKIARQLNKGESLHSLRRSLLYAHEGAIRHRHLSGQTEQAWCLTLLTNSVVTWTTEYYGLAIAQMRAEGRAVDDELLAHISPAHSENVNFFGTINVEVDTELAKLDLPATGRCEPAAVSGPERQGLAVVGFCMQGRFAAGVLLRSWGWSDRSQNRLDYRHPTIGKPRTPIDKGWARRAVRCQSRTTWTNHSMPESSPSKVCSSCTPAVS
ncbi:Tn3 family transposase [Streptomyces sp. NPDC048258]|uniref:Tn3 family transposase n=1 Tax=Streptomyces sp. NPDC048258 TaxID=3365527 RepID=UPI003714411D